MTMKVKLFVSMKNEAVARPLGVRRLRQAPARGQRFQIPLDGRAVHARITRFSSAGDTVSPTSVPTVHAEEI
jgi:hypothetical protein